MSDLKGRKFGYVDGRDDNNFNVLDYIFYGHVQFFDPKTERTASVACIPDIEITPKKARSNKKTGEKLCQ